MSNGLMIAEIDYIFVTSLPVFGQFESSNVWIVSICGYEETVDSSVNRVWGAGRNLFNPRQKSVVGFCIHGIGISGYIKFGEHFG
jgi:hypothetical protein